MDPKDLLVHLDSSPRVAERLGIAVALARRFGARLTGLFAESATLGSSLLGRRAPENVARAAADARAKFEAACAGVPSRFWQLEPTEYSELVGWVAVCCRQVDLVILGQRQGDDAPVPEGLVEEVIAGSGRPVLIVPSAGRFSDVGKRVVVAWTGSREATRALHDALPLLRGAESVTVLSLQLPNEGTTQGGLPPLDILEHLRAHGVEARYDRWLVSDLAAVDAVLNRASDEAADLTVIGAYGLLGGPRLRPPETTRKILETMTTPVLLSC
ncbi:MAG TPA: universal stress protein [Anaeromyxobacter sp.]